jgi:hypothetical protein
VAACIMEAKTSAVTVVASMMLTSFLAIGSSAKVLTMLLRC